MCETVTQIHKPGVFYGQNFTKGNEKEQPKARGKIVGTRCIAEVQGRKDKTGHKREKSGYSNNKYTNSGMD